MLRCGVLGWAILDGENEEFTVRWSLPSLAFSVAAWLAGWMLAWLLRHAIQGPAAATSAHRVLLQASDGEDAGPDPAP